MQHKTSSSSATGTPFRQAAFLCVLNTCCTTTLVFCQTEQADSATLTQFQAQRSHVLTSIGAFCPCKVCSTVPAAGGTSKPIQQVMVLCTAYVCGQILSNQIETMLSNKCDQDQQKVLSQPRNLTARSPQLGAQLILAAASVLLPRRASPHGPRATVATGAVMERVLVAHGEGAPVAPAAEVPAVPAADALPVRGVRMVDGTADSEKADVMPAAVPSVAATAAATAASHAAKATGTCRHPCCCHLCVQGRRGPAAPR